MVDRQTLGAIRLFAVLGKLSDYLLAGLGLRTQPWREG
jgi:hypothetical protein